ncbi:MAG TPA: HD domain-containing phosphohydrolase [Syntrophomonas sp.]|nr:HD domain-containing phosphohydrolase [Syntrophomonas sp.]
MAFFELFLTYIPLIALCSYMLLMLFFCIAQKDYLIRSFMLVLGALILTTASAVFMSIQLYPGVLFWDRVMVIGALTVPVLLYYFVSVFTNALSFYKNVFWGLITLIFIVFNLLGLIVIDAGTITNTVSIWGHSFQVVKFHYIIGPIAAPMYAFALGITIATMAKAKRSRTGSSPVAGNGSINLVTGGLAIMFLGNVCNLIPALGQYPVDILACLINVFLLVVAIYKYRLVEMRFMITRGLVYSLFVIALTVPYVFGVFYIQNHLRTQYHQVIPYLTTLAALAVAVALQPLYRLSYKLVDKFFYRAEYSQRQALRRFSTRISNNLDLNGIARELIEAVQLALNASHVLILQKDEERQNYTVFATSSQLFQPDLQISFDNPIIKWLSQNDTGLTREQLYYHPSFKSMWEQEKNKLYDNDIELIIPIKIKDNIISLLMLTRRKNNVAYTLDDLDLLTYLGASSAVAFENASLYTRSQNDAVTDGLTKLYNHRYFFQVLSDYMKKIGSAELSLLMIDMDLFKLYNDLFGHFEGDRALEMIAAILKRNVADKGIICRYGGEEFTVILPYYDSGRAFDLAERIRTEIESSFFNNDNLTQRFLTASIGICTYPQAAPNMEELLKRADLAMYTAKNQGKNQTVIYTPRIASMGDDSPHSVENELKPHYTATIYALAAAIDAKDHYTFGHSQRVAQYVTLLANEMSLDKAYIEILQEAALLHDIGKLGVPENILTKAGKLSNEEAEIVKKHVEMSITIIKHLPTLNHVIPAVIGHHERWDGKGYPRGLKGENIPFSARCLAIADAFDALTSDRPYRAGMTVNNALAEMKNNIGTQFDPAMANLFIKLVQDGTIKVVQPAEIPDEMIKVAQPAEIRNIS